MLSFNNAPDWFKVFGLRLVYLHLALFVFCLPPFHLGTWIQIEPVNFLLYVLAIFNCLWMIVGIFRRWIILRNTLHPVIVLLIAGVVWQCITLTYVDNPLVAWLGRAQLGQGVAFNIISLLIVFLVMPYWLDKAYNKKILLVSAASVLAMAYLHFDLRMIYDPYAGTEKAYSIYLEENELAPAGWTDYLIFLISWLWIVYATMPQLRTRLLNVFMVGVFFAILALSNNKIAYFVMPPMMVITIVMLALQAIKEKPRWLESFLYVGKFWRLMAVAGIVLPLSWIIISDQYYNIEDYSSAYKYGDEHILKCNNAAIPYLCKNLSVTERAVFNKVIVDSLENPFDLLFGKGWGSFADAFFNYQLVDGLHSYSNGKLYPNFQEFYGFTISRSTHFHSQGQQPEILHSLGLVGLILFTAIPIIMIVLIRKEFFWWCVPILIGINVVALFWFLIGQMLAIQALFIVAWCMASLSKEDSRDSFIPKIVLVFPAVMMVMMSLSAVEQAKGIGYGMKFWNVYFAKTTPVPYKDTEWLEEDIKRGGDRIFLYITRYVIKLSENIYCNLVNENDVYWYRDFIRFSHKAALSVKDGDVLGLLEPYLSMRLLFDFRQPSALDDLKPEVKKTIFASMLRFTRSFPKREDFMAPFLININEISGDDTHKEREMLEQILQVNPNHRSVLWLLGGVYESMPDMRDKGVAMKRRAISLGVEKVYPVTQEEAAIYM